MGISLSDIKGMAYSTHAVRFDEKNLFANLPKPTRPKRPLEYFSKYVKVCRDQNLTRAKSQSGTGHRAPTDSVALFEFLVTSQQDSPATRNKRVILTPIESLVVFKNVMLEDEFCLMFDLEGLMLGCRQFLLKVQRSAHRATDYHRLREIGLFLIALGPPGSKQEVPKIVWEDMHSIIQEYEENEWIKAQKRVGTVKGPLVESDEELNKGTALVVNRFEMKRMTKLARVARMCQSTSLDIAGLREFLWIYIVTG
ncbi:hypothetical protein P171DRAFT_443599 [Karstenula rhodostoma CBS 690.94]|uniref:Uncharacterized protein n=1 Tax=Karstenula rhodostoma CBS 690.94 TaxID=1392251 RepID=A0A9P4UBV1_9PLEO|nr:hypothetical protein P171DRAFT_443599 [Karstenula rhodostoma CBS 690.94]